MIQLSIYSQFQLKIEVLSLAAIKLLTINFQNKINIFSAVKEILIIK
jgi:hypothetical protein